jgi:hypothetical protein
MWLAMLAMACLFPERLDPWHGWVAFKRYVRVVDEVPDPGISVQISAAPLEHALKLYFVRQAVVRQVVEGNGTRWLEPLGGVVCELTYPENVPVKDEWELWSFDCPSLEHFVDRVEQHPAFADLVTREPLGTRVYWRRA